ncbi:hypothetical protein BDZ89DRAFT_1163903 [Hymenopellis radicata]|nr:hypothetical protein BDZ89DRAFT_1163903 [Hymenopellis radicata]
MARYNKRLAPVDACFLDARDAKRARFAKPPVPDARSTLRESSHSGYSAQYALSGVHGSENGLESHIASDMSREDERDRESYQADEESEHATKLTPVIQARLEGIERYTHGLSSYFYQMIIQDLDGYHGAKTHNRTMAADIVEHCAKIAREGRSDLRHEKYVAWKASELCYPGGSGEPEMSASEDEADEVDGGTFGDTNGNPDVTFVRTGGEVGHPGNASIRTLQPHPYDQSFTTRSYSQQPRTTRYEFERDLPPRTSHSYVDSSNAVPSAENGTLTSGAPNSVSRKEGQRRAGGLLLSDLLNP